MKKIFSLLLSAVILFSLASCAPGGDIGEAATDSTSSLQTESTPSKATSVTATEEASETFAKTNNTETLTEIDINDIMSGDSSTDVIWGKQDEATKQQIIAEAKKDGVDISFGDDGSMMVVDPASGETIIQNPDGTWSVASDDGIVGQFGGNWPENEFTVMLPKPEMELLTAATNEQEFTVGFNGATIDQVRDYVEQVKAKGFTVDAETQDEEVMGMVIYNYTAKNAEGYTVTVSSAMGVSAVILEKP